jgi:hypothetical protein
MNPLNRYYVARGNESNIKVNYYNELLIDFLKLIKKGEMGIDREVLKDEDFIEKLWVAFDDFYGDSLKVYYLDDEYTLRFNTIGRFLGRVLEHNDNLNRAINPLSLTYYYKESNFWDAWLDIFNVALKLYGGIIKHNGRIFKCEALVKPVWWDLEKYKKNIGE